jgi:integrase
MSTRARYQFGCLTRRKRIRTADVWQFRFYETTTEGRRCRRSRMIGTLAQFPTKGDALRIVERFRLRMNLNRRFARPVTLDALVDHYAEEELARLRYGTQQAHLCSLRRRIRPRWGACLLEDIKPVAVEQWLRSLALAPKTKVNLRSLFHLVYQHGRRWELIDGNPIELVRQNGGRRSIPRTLNVDEIRTTFDNYAGTYELGSGVEYVVSVEDGKLIGQRTGRKKEELLPETPDVFFRKGVPGRRTFCGIAKGMS